ncbi:MAG TPA: acetyl-CoA carboxylase carboxyltransferase subunit alpha [Alphaproteobacteria bacterium]|nr:acetyl-CoA carboxylase carboxyltransferase subunit alpha [Alphaproteobacteria bacterium]
MPQHYLEFEAPLLELASRMEDLLAAQEAGEATAVKNIPAELARLDVRMARITRLLYRRLDPIQKMQVARHPERPQGGDYLKALVPDFVPLAGDRRFGEDKALLAGVGHWQGEVPCVVFAIDKGKNTAERLAKNFGMLRPEGYRKAQRLMQMAGRLNLPVIALVDTPGAFPGIDAEERGQAEAIATCLEMLMQLPVPVVSVIIGEGGSGGALALSAADRVFMLEHSIYSVISPEGCAAILWKEATKETIPQAADALKITAQDLEKLGVIDGIIKEPVGAAHRDPALAIKRVGDIVAQALAEVEKQKSPRDVSRRAKFIKMAV